METINWDDHGYWLSPDGKPNHVYRAPWWCHAAWAMEYLHGLGESVRVEDASSNLLRRGWIKVSRDTFEAWRLGEKELRLIAGFVRAHPLYKGVPGVRVYETGPGRLRTITLNAMP